MEFLCVVALLLSAGAARSDPQRQWWQENPQFPPFGGPQQTDETDFKPNDGDQTNPPFWGQPMGEDEENPGLFGDEALWPGWEANNPDSPWSEEDSMGPGDLPPHFDTDFDYMSNGPGDYPGQDEWWGKPVDGRPESGRPNGGRPYGNRPGRPVGGRPGGDRPGRPVGGRPGGRPVGGRPGGDRPGRPEGGRPGGDRPGRPVGGRPGGRPVGGRPGRPVGGRPGGRPGRPVGGRPSGRPNGGRPNMSGGGNREFIPLFRADNVTVQNVTALHLKEGENTFLLPKGGRGPPPAQDGQNAPLGLAFGQPYGFQPYLKLIYNPTAATRVSFEYGITQLL